MIEVFIGTTIFSLGFLFGSMWASRGQNRKTADEVEDQIPF